MINNPPEIIIPYRLSRSFIRSHPEWIFVYGDAVTNRSYEGQCDAAKGESNCFMVPTKWNPCSSEPPQSFFNDDQFHLNQNVIDTAIGDIETSLESNPRPVILFPKIGCGKAQMPKKCPKTYAYLMERLNKIVYLNVKRDYNWRVE